MVVEIKIMAVVSFLELKIYPLTLKPAFKPIK